MGSPVSCWGPAARGSELGTPGSTSLSLSQPLFLPASSLTGQEVREKSGSVCSSSWIGQLASSQGAGSPVSTPSDSQRDVLI